MFTHPLYRRKYLQGQNGQFNDNNSLYQFHYYFVDTSRFTAKKMLTIKRTGIFITLHRPAILGVIL